MYTDGTGESSVKVTPAHSGFKADEIVVLLDVRGLRQPSAGVLKKSMDARTYVNVLPYGQSLAHLQYARPRKQFLSTSGRDWKFFRRPYLVWKRLKSIGCTDAW